VSETPPKDGESGSASREPNAARDAVTPHDAPRPLPVVRAMIDALDRELLQLLARRMTLVSEVAAYKRAHGLKVRDLAREQSVLHDRGARAEALGLPREEIESVFRVLLRASREQQAALRAEVPVAQTARTVAVIGAHGGLGQLLVRLFGDLGHHVLPVDIDTTLRAVDAAAMADVTVLSVPIAVTEAVIAEVGPHVREDALLMDVTSLKAAPVAAMLAHTRASVVGTHPMFGPSVHTLQGQRVVLCRGRGDAWFDWVAQTFAARGLVVTEATPAAHDQAMAVVQVLNHFQTQVFGLTLARLGVPVADTRPYTSPSYLLELYVAARHFAQDSALYGPIEMRNPALAHVTTALQQAAHDLAAILTRGDQAAFDAVFEEVRGYFGEFTTEALAQSRFLIDRIVEQG
jgi:chorismate mutase/prephenate dehydrogenase